MLGVYLFCRWGHIYYHHFSIYRTMFCRYQFCRSQCDIPSFAIRFGSRIRTPPEPNCGLGICSSFGIAKPGQNCFPTCSKDSFSVSFPFLKCRLLSLLNRASWNSWSSTSRLAFLRCGSFAGFVGVLPFRWRAGSLGTHRTCQASSASGHHPSSQSTCCGYLSCWPCADWNSRRRRWCTWEYSGTAWF